MPRSQRRSSLAANLVLLVGSLVFAGMLLALLEGALRLTGVVETDVSNKSRLKYQQLYFPILDAAQLPDGDEILRPVDTRLPYQAIRKLKPPNLTRIFVMGGSAAAGLGFSPNVTFARYLENMLRLAYPDHFFEVMNLSIVALSSKQVKLLVAEICKNYDPDLLVVYSGNNEFLEVHAQKYARIHASLSWKLRDLMMKTHLYWLATRAFRTPQKPTQTGEDFSKEDLRLTEHTIIEEVEMTPSDVKLVVDQYHANFEEIAEIARSTGTPLLFMTVASNWKWRGRDDLPDGWLAEILGSAAPPTPDRYRAARRILTERIAASAHRERYEWLYRRAVIGEALGDFEAARTDYREALNEDPHLRRALDVMNDRVRETAGKHGVPLLDVVELLQDSARHQILGFDEFYDYVHFTPRGALLTAAGLFRAMQRDGIVPPARGFDPDDYVRERQNELVMLDEDYLGVEAWIGFSFDRTLMDDRDLWKYDRMLEELDRRLERNSNEVAALVYRGNANYFRIDGAEAAVRDYKAALALDKNNSVIRANLERLLAERRP